MRIVSEEQLGAVLAALPGVPRVVAGGNFATPWPVLAVLDAVVAEYRLFMLNAQPSVPDRVGVILESPFVGSGMPGTPWAALLPLPPVAGPGPAGRRAAAGRGAGPDLGPG